MPKRKPSIVFVDRDINYIRDFHNGFLDSSFDSAVFDSGQKALDYIFSVPVDIIVTELDLAKMTGLELIDLIKSDQRSSHIHSFILSKEGSYYNSIDAQKIGADQYIVKDTIKVYRLLLDKVSCYIRVN